MPRSLQLQLLIGKVIPMPAPAPLIDALDSVQVTTGVGQQGGFQLTFAVSKPSIITQALLPSGALDPETRVILMAIVGGMPHVLIDGIVTRQEMSPSNDPAGSRLTLSGEDLTSLFDMVTERMKLIPGPDNVQVMTLCAKPRYAVYGIVPFALPPVFPKVNTSLDTAPVQSGTDLQYIQGLAYNCGYTFFIQSGPLPGMNVAYFGPEARFGLIQPALTMNMGAATNVDSMSFSYDGLSRTQYIVTIVEPTTKFPIGIPVPDVGLLKPPLAARPAMTLRKKPLPDTSKLKFSDALMRGLSRTAEASDAISGQGQLDVLRYGQVLKPRHLVGVRGAGLAYDGIYFVKSVTHTIKRGEYKQSFSLARDGLVSLTPAVIP